VSTTVERSSVFFSITAHFNCLYLDVVLVTSEVSIQGLVMYLMKLSTFTFSESDVVSGDTRHVDELSPDLTETPPAMSSANHNPHGGNKLFPVSMVTSFYELSAQLLSGRMEQFSKWEGRVSLVVNIATGDKLTRQELHQVLIYILAKIANPTPTIFVLIISYQDNIYILRNCVGMVIDLGRMIT
jgi:hypothetical protein